MNFPFIYDLLHNNEPKTLFWFVIILILLIYLIDNIFLIIIFYSIIIYYIHSYIHTNQFKESYDINNKYDDAKLKYDKFKNYKNIINFLYNLTDFKKYNISKFRDIEQNLYNFIIKYDCKDNPQLYYNELVDIRHNIISILESFKLDVYDKEHNILLEKLKKDIDDILKKYIDEIYEKYNYNLVKDGIKNDTKLLNNISIKPSNFLENNDLFENKSFNKLKISTIL